MKVTFKEKPIKAKEENPSVEFRIWEGDCIAIAIFNLGATFGTVIYTSEEQRFSLGQNDLHRGGTEPFNGIIEIKQ